jgi:hypothetical protein
MQAQHDNPLGRVLGGVMPVNAPRQPRGQWLIEPMGYDYYWAPEGSDPAPEPPAILKRLVQKNLPGSYQIISATDEARPPRRGGTPLYTLESYLEKLSTQQGSSKDTYNPFGRFTTGASAFLPSSNCPAGVLDELAEKEKSFCKVVDTSKEMATPLYPLFVQVETGETLYFCGENPFGATYSDTPPALSNGQILPPQAAHDASRRKDPATAGLNLAAAAEQIRMVANEAITQGMIGAHTGKKREKSQTQVMGASAGEAAEAAGYARNEGAGWEWLHLIAHSMGGIAVQGPQVPGNLVAGTSECNTQMIVVEEFLKDCVKKLGGMAKLMVFAELLDADYHIGKAIRYDFEIYNADGDAIEVFHWFFDPLSRRNPMVMENRSLRATGRDAMADENLEPSPHLPRSEPTAHSSIDPARREDPEDQIAGAMRSMDPPTFAAWLGSLRDAQPNGRLHKMFFIEIGDTLIKGLLSGDLTQGTALGYVLAINARISGEAAKYVADHVNESLPGAIVLQ